MNKIISLFVEDENYEFTVIIKKVNKEEVSKAKKFAKESRYESPFAAISLGRPVKIDKLYFHPNFQEYCPV